MVAALALACVLIQRIYPKLIERPFLLFFLALTAYPIFRGVLGGQNTGLSILLIVLCWSNVLHNKHYQAGIFLGLLFFKPQFAAALTGLFLLSGRWRVWASAGATVIVLFAVNAALLGPDWLIDWFDGVRNQFLYDGQFDFAALISWFGIALIAVVVLLSRLDRLNPNLLLAVWAAGLVELLSVTLGFSPSFIPLVLILAMAARYLWTSSTKNAEALPA